MTVIVSIARTGVASYAVTLRSADTLWGPFHFVVQPSPVSVVTFDESFSEWSMRPGSQSVCRAVLAFTKLVSWSDGTCGPASPRYRSCPRHATAWEGRSLTAAERA